MVFVSFRASGAVREVAHAPLPVGETGEVKRKGSIKGGGSPGLHKPMSFDGGGRSGKPFIGAKLYPCVAPGVAPLSGFSFFKAKGIVTEWPGQGCSLARCAVAHRARPGGAAVRCAHVLINSKAVIRTFTYPSPPGSSRLMPFLFCNRSINPTFKADA